MVDFPDVPDVAGVPALARLATASIPLPARALLDAVGLSNLFTPQWGIFFNGTPFITGDSVLSVEFSHDYAVSNYPVENGGFASYNKVAQPFVAKISFGLSGAFSLRSLTDAYNNFEDAGGSVSLASVGSALAGITGSTGRSKFLGGFERVLPLTDIYSVVTPEITYPNATIVHYDYRRESRQGATLIVVDVWVQEVRIVTTGVTSGNTAAPQSATTVDQGTVQPLSGPTGSSVTPVSSTPLSTPGATSGATGNTFAGAGVTSTAPFDPNTGSYLASNFSTPPTPTSVLVAQPGA